MAGSTPRIDTKYSDRLWGRGQLKRLATRWLHGRLGHNWGQWNVEPPVDEWETPISPDPDTRVFCFRACQGDCGTIQTTVVRFDQHRELPDA